MCPDSDSQHSGDDTARLPGQCAEDSAKLPGQCADDTVKLPGQCADDTVNLPGQCILIVVVLDNYIVCGGGAMGQSVRTGSERFGDRMPAATDLSRKNR